MQFKGILLAIVTLLPGCASMQDFHYEATNGLRSQLAWYRAAPNVRQGLCPSDYGKGWKLGYFAVTMGGGCHPPSFPPTHYWSAHYQSPAGQAEIAAWYRGYQDGAIRAERRGAGSFHYLHAHDDGSYGGGQVIESTPAQPEAVPEIVPPGTTSILHSDSVGSNPPGTVNAGARASQSGRRSARVQPARPSVRANVSEPGQLLEQPSLMPADHFPAPPLGAPALMQPTSMQPVEDDPDFGALAPTTATGIEKSSWTTVESQAQGQTASQQFRRPVMRLPPVLPPLFDPPAPAGIKR